VKVQLYASLTSTLDGKKWSDSGSDRFTTRQTSRDTYWIRGLVVTNLQTNQSPYETITTPGTE